MLAEGKTQRDVAEYYGFRDKQVVKKLLECERRKERKLEAGILLRPKGRPRKDAAPKDIVAERAYEIQRLRMENQLLGDFLRFTAIAEDFFSILKTECIYRHKPATSSEAR